MWCGIDWINVTQDRDKWHVMNLWLHKIWGIHLSFESHVGSHSQCRYSCEDWCASSEHIALLQYILQHFVSSTLCQ